MEHESITDEQAMLAADLFLLRAEGKAAAVTPEFLPAAHALVERGWVSRRIQDDDLIWELTDAGLVAVRLNSLKRGAPEDFN